MIPTFAHFRLAGWVGACACVVGGVRSWGPPSSETPVEPLTVAAPIELPQPELGPVDLSRAGRAVIERNPFRVERRPTDVRFAGGPAPDASEPADQGQVLSANVQLDGLIGGVSGTAVLSGVADFPSGIVISIGETRGDVTLLAIQNDSAVLTVSGQRVVLGMKVLNR